ncbi:MAG: hypothetical protein B7X55_12615 [Rhodobacterales bacterium 34-62-10]|nr:MAG: hypothetical protein B7X55_12615 [Rhodobacterales bacterium 34-62-10]
MQPAIHRLLELGPVRSEIADDEIWWLKWVAALDDLVAPVTDDEAIALASLFRDFEDRSTYFTLVHAIETAPGWPIAEILDLTGTDWIGVLKVRWENYEKKTR